MTVKLRVSSFLLPVVSSATLCRRGEWACVQSLSLNTVMNISQAAGSSYHFSHCKCFVEPRTFPGSPLILLIQGCFHVCVPSRAGTTPALVCQGCHDPGTQGLPQQTFLSSQPLRLAGQDPCLGSVVSSEASLGPADEVSCVLMVMARCPHLFLL